jgi:hypothetical protein
MDGGAVAARLRHGAGQAAAGGAGALHAALPGRCAVHGLAGLGARLAQQAARRLLLACGCWAMPYMLGTLPGLVAMACIVISFPPGFPWCAPSDDGVNAFVLPGLRLKGQAGRTRGASLFAWHSGGDVLAVASKRRWAPRCSLAAGPACAQRFLAFGGLTVPLPALCHAAPWSLALPVSLVFHAGPWLPLSSLTRCAGWPCSSTTVWSLCSSGRQPCPTPPLPCASLAAPPSTPAWRAGGAWGAGRHSWVPPLPLCAGRRGAGGPPSPCLCA